MDRMPKRGEKITIKPEMIAGKRYIFDGDNRQFKTAYEDLKGKILTVRTTGSNIFDLVPPHAGVLNSAMVDSISELSEEALFDAFVMGDISQNEYEELRKERG